MSKTVLIVEDNELNMKLFHDLLDAHGYQTLQTKDGIIGFSKSVALELGSRNIRCNAIAPGFIETDMTHYLKDGWGVFLLRLGLITVAETTQSLV